MKMGKIMTAAHSSFLGVNVIFINIFLEMKEIRWATPSNVLWLYLASSQNERQRRRTKTDRADLLERLNTLNGVYAWTIALPDCVKYTEFQGRCPWLY